MCVETVRREGFGLGVVVGLIWGLRDWEAAVMMPRPQACALGRCCVWRLIEFDNFRF